MQGVGDHLLADKVADMADPRLWSSLNASVQRSGNAGFDDIVRQSGRQEDASKRMTSFKFQRRVITSHGASIYSARSFAITRTTTVRSSLLLETFSVSDQMSTAGSLPAIGVSICSLVQRSGTTSKSYLHTLYTTCFKNHLHIV